MKKFEKATLRKRITSRGGGIEISLDSFGFKGEAMTAYQNYLGGGMLGKIGNDCTIKDWRSNEKLTKLAEKLAKYYHKISGQETDFEQLQKFPVSAY